MVLIWGHDAEKLMEFVYKNRKAHVRIELKEPPTWVSGPSLQPWPGHCSHPHLPLCDSHRKPSDSWSSTDLKAPQANSVPSCAPLGKFLPQSGLHLQDEKIGPAEF